MAVTSTAWAGAATGEEGVAEAAIVAGLLGVAVGAAPGGEDAVVVGLVGVAAASVVVGEATAGEVEAAPPEGAAGACPNIFDMRLVNIPITAKDTPRLDERPAQPFYFLQLSSCSIGH
jgi:hypothetical protein